VIDIMSMMLLLAGLLLLADVGRPFQGRQGGAESPALQRRNQTVTGMIVEVKRAERVLVVSHDPVEGAMPAMIMPFPVRAGVQLSRLTPGTIVSFTVRSTEGYADDLKVIRYQSGEQDPLAVQRLRLLRSARAPQLVAGQDVPDFSLTNQGRKPVTLSQFRGKIVVMNFIYTSCALPQFCYRMTNHFGVLQSRFAGQGGHDLVLLSVTFDPGRDTPERLAEYAAQWKADPARWHFLTGPPDDIKRVADSFGLDFFPDEGLISHSLRTVVIDRSGRLSANVEGNQFTAQQLGDLVGAALKR
jgi:protein SCO1